MAHKIAFVGDFKKIWNEEGIARSFEKIGVEVHRFQESVDINVIDWIERIEEIRPDVVLMAKLKIGGGRDGFIEQLKKRKIKTASWTFDLYFGHRREQLIGKDPIFRCDYIFGPDGGNIQRFRSRGINYHLLRQGIFDGFCYKGEWNERYDYDVVFVGHYNGTWSQRGNFYDKIKKRYKFRWFGRWDTDEIRGDKLNELYATAKIVIGDSWPSKSYWSNRLYETLGRGGFLMFQAIQDLDTEYTPYKHYIPYPIYDFDALAEKIDYFLNKPEEREKISNEALEYTKEHHTLIQRCESFMQEILTT